MKYSETLETLGRKCWILTCGSVQEGAQQLHLRLQLGQPEVDSLVVEHRQLEDLPLPGVLDRLLDDDVHRGQDSRDNGDSSVSVQPPTHSTQTW